MPSRNPVFARSAAFRPQSASRQAPGAAPDTLSTAAGLEQRFAAPAASSVDTGRMTVEDTLGKTVFLFVVLLAAAALGWFVPMLAFPGAIIGFVLVFVNSFKRTPSAPLIIAYAAAEGLFVGGISAIFEGLFNGVVIQAVLATLVVLGVTLALFASGKIRASKRMTKIFMIALVGYAVFSFVNMFFIWFGDPSMAFGLRSATIAGIPIGLLLGVFAVLLAAYSLVLDFDFVKQGVANRLPRAFGWYGGFGIMVTLVWLYIEFLRLFAISSRN